MPEEDVIPPVNPTLPPVSPTPVVNPTSTTPVPKKSNKMLVWILVAVLVLLAMGAGGYFLFIGNTTTEQPAPQTADTATPEATSSPTIAITDELKKQMMKDFEITSTINKPPLIMLAYVKGQDIKIWRANGVYAGLELLTKDEMADGSFSSFSTPAFAKKINGLWTVVYASQDAPSCDLLIKNKFTPEDIKGLFTNGPTCPSS